MSLVLNFNPQQQTKSNLFIEYAIGKRMNVDLECLKKFYCMKKLTKVDNLCSI